MSPVVESVRWDGDFCFAMLWQAGVHVCGERHVGGGIGNLGSVVGGSARVGPDGEVQVMPSCSPACPSSVSVSRIRGILVFGPCICGCGSKAFRLHIWARVLGFLLVIMILE